MYQNNKSYTIRAFLSERKNLIDVETIIKVVSEFYKVHPDLMLSKTRERIILIPRQVAMMFSYHKTKASLKTIGSKIGGKNHATVLHACKTISDLYDTDKFFRKELEDINDKILQEQKLYVKVTEDEIRSAIYAALRIIIQNRNNTIKSCQSQISMLSHQNKKLKRKLNSLKLQGIKSSQMQKTKQKRYQNTTGHLLLRLSNSKMAI